jgi:Leucine-rich repeat (LRR) protein
LERREISRPAEIVNRVWEVSHDFVARLLGPIVKHSSPTFWERFRPILYPLSVAAWVLIAGSLIFAGPYLVRKATESILEKRYQFSIQETTHGYNLKETNRHFNDLSAANPYLGKLGQITLDLTYCDKLTSVDGLQGLANLQTLNLSGCTSLTNVDALKSLTALQRLDLTGSSVSPDEIAALKRALPSTYIYQ